MLHVVPKFSQRFISSLYYIGHLIFEMCAGYELTEVRPGPEAYRAVPSAVRPIMEFIFADGFPHSIREVRHVIWMILLAIVIPVCSP